MVIMYVRTVTLTILILHIFTYILKNTFKETIFLNFEMRLTPPPSPHSYGLSRPSSDPPSFFSNSGHVKGTDRPD
jgi:hypothetical protein